MCFKNVRRTGIGSVVLVAFAAFCGGPLFGQERVVDGIAAVVNDRVITLIDVQVIEAFGIHEGSIETDIGASRRAILEKLIDQKVVLDLSRGVSSIAPERIEAVIAGTVARLGEEEMRARLARFGFTIADLRPYLEEKLLVTAVVDDRFNRSVTVNLDEIESRYQNRYVAVEKKAGRTPRPFLEVVDALEKEIRAEIIAVQSALWVQSLREQAEIEIRPDILKK